MCGRYYVDPETNSELRSIIRNLDRRLSLQQKSSRNSSNHPTKIKTGEVFPSDCAPIIMGQKPIYDAMCWGYKNPAYSRLLINARAETVTEKPLFSKDFHNFRVVVPATGFFEWTNTKEKEKFLFYNSEFPLIYMAGFYKPDPVTPRFLILTTAANSCMKDIHDRIPVLLTKEEVPSYLGKNDFADYVLHRESLNLSRRKIPKDNWEQLSLPINDWVL